jgi:hypothetical protein
MPRWLPLRGGVTWVVRCIGFPSRGVVTATVAAIDKAACYPQRRHETPPRHYAYGTARGLVGWPQNKVRYLVQLSILSTILRVRLRGMRRSARNVPTMGGGRANRGVGHVALQAAAVDGEPPRRRGGGSPVRTGFPATGADRPRGLVYGLRFGAPGCQLSCQTGRHDRVPRVGTLANRPREAIGLGSISVQTTKTKAAYDGRSRQAIRAGTKLRRSPHRGIRTPSERLPITDRFDAGRIRRPPWREAIGRTLS